AVDEVVAVTPGQHRVVLAAAVDRVVAGPALEMYMPARSAGSSQDVIQLVADSCGERLDFVVVDDEILESGRQREVHVHGTNRIHAACVDENVRRIVDDEKIVAQTAIERVNFGLVTAEA